MTVTYYYFLRQGGLGWRCWRVQPNQYRGFPPQTSEYIFIPYPKEAVTCNGNLTGVKFAAQHLQDITLHLWKDLGRNPQRYHCSILELL